MRKQVKIKAASEAEHQRWKAEVRRRGWTLTHLVRMLLNDFVDRAEEERERLGLKGLR